MNRRHFLTAAALLGTPVVSHTEQLVKTDDTGRLVGSDSLCISVTDFGAMADGVTDDSYAIQSAIDYAQVNGYSCVGFPSGTYRVGKSIRVYSNSIYMAMGFVVIVQEICDEPIIRSSDSAPPTGYTVIRGSFILQGNPQMKNNHGIYLHDYYSIIDGVEVRSCGGHGVFVSEWSYSGKLASGTLVENKIFNIRSVGVSGSAIRVGHKPNSKLTDGFISNVIVNSASLQPSLFINSSAGWQIDKIHCYGRNTPEVGLYFSNLNCTIIRDVYLEGFKRVGFHFDRIQEAFIVQSVIMKTNSINKFGNVMCFLMSATRMPALSIEAVVLHSVNRPIVAVGESLTPCSIDTSAILTSGVYSSLVVKNDCIK